MRRVLVLLLLILPMVAWTAPLLPAGPTPLELARVEQIVSSIEPTKWYSGSDVQDAIRSLLVASLEESYRSVAEAVEAAQAPLLAEGLRLESQVRTLKWCLAGTGAAALAATIALLIHSMFGP